MIYVDEIEHFFPKKNVKKFKPKCLKFKKDLVEQIQKHFTADDRVTVILSTSQPSLVAVTEVKKLAKRYFYFPFPDYTARVNIFKTIISKHVPNSDFGFIIQTLALHSEGYSFGSIKNALKMVFLKERIEKLEIILLKAEEIIFPLSKMLYTSAEEYLAFKEMTNILLDIKEKQAKLEAVAKENISSKPQKPKPK